MKKIILALALLLTPSLAWAQCSGVFPNNTFCGNSTGGGAPRPIPFSSLVPTLTIGSTIIFGGTDTYILYNKAGVLGNEHFIPLANGGLGGSQAAATAGQVPVFPGSGGPAVPTTITQCLLYAPISGDNTAALNAISTQAVASGLTLCIPAATIQVSGTWFLPSGLRVAGSGMGITTIQKTPASAAVTFVSFQNVGNIFVHDLTFDLNGPNVNTGQYFGLAGTGVNNFTLQRVGIKNPYNGALLEIIGNGTTPTVPDGNQLNSNIVIRDSVFDASSTNVSPANGDVVDILQTNGLIFENNKLLGGVGCGANGFAFEFNINFSIRNNKVNDCWVSFYNETGQDGIFDNNSVFATGAQVSANGDVRMIGIWLADANQTYSGGNYAGNKRVNVTNNHIQNIGRSVSGTTGVQCFINSAPSVVSQDIFVGGNTCYSVGAAGSGPIQGFRFEGGMETQILRHNFCRSFSGGSSQACTSVSNSYTSSGMPSAQSSLDMLFADNFSTTVTPMQTPAPTCTSTGGGSGTSCTVGTDSVDSHGIMTITAGTSASGNGVISLTLGSSMGRSASACTATLLQGSGWQGTATVIVDSTNPTQPSFDWDNGGVGLTNTDAYSFVYDCKGR